MSLKSQTKTHIWIPDTQIEPGRPTKHVEWAGQFIADEYGSADLTVIVGGDWWNMGSLSSYDRRGGKLMEGRRYIKDVDSGNDAWDRFNEPWKDIPCRRVYLRGNHEERIMRVVAEDASQEGLVGYHHLAVDQWDGWEVHEFLEVATIDGIAYSHYFVNPSTGRPIGGQSMDTRLKTVGYTFTMGHQQGLKVGMRYLTNGTRQRALAAGSFYLHDEDYLTPQGNNDWRGILVCHQVENGNYDLMEVSLDYLCRRYEGKRLSAFRWRH